MNFPQTLNQIIEGHDLNFETAQSLMNLMMTGQLSDIEISAVLTALRQKGETITEIAAFASVMRQHATSIQLTNPEKAIDTCGTGGDHSNTFNISTTVAFVLAAQGIPVAKHGNRSASSKSGSADVLEALGINLDLQPEQVAQCIEKINLGFLFAPKHHGSIKHVMTVRKTLKIRTVFNILGPLTNPAGAQNQVIGVFAPEFVAKMAAVLQQLGTKSAMIVHGSGLDEITTTGPTQISQLENEIINDFTIHPSDFKIPTATLEDLKGGTPAENATITKEILQGSQSPKADIVILNAAAGFVVSGLATDFNEGIQIARETLSSQTAYQKLQELSQLTNSFTK